MRLKYILLLLTVVAVLFSFVGAKESFTWWLEAFPVFLGILALAIFRKFEFSNFVYCVIFLHFLVLLLGAHFTYAEVPGFRWMNNFLGGNRNNYDKIGHFVQGFSPALIAREILIRKKVLNKISWLPFLVMCIVLAISGTYELLEWAVSVFSGDSGDSFLGTQGYIWDTQTDIFAAFLGGLCALIFFSGFQDKMIKNNF
ncbi:DUF2238 domain-containing protein [Kaistella palustris]|uniref:DUF2238 domain-containing protein n=1 Tax=Kaistella palustris TaxID=493376 RepID=UPI000406F09C|nr:DUF2238 domain-containing protein [Kaistella palustris]